MPDVLTLETPHFELLVWTKEVVKPQKQLSKTHEARGVLLPTNTVRFNPLLTIVAATPLPVIPIAIQPVAELTLPEALFFENKQYEFEFLFSKAVSITQTPRVIHRLSSVEDSFHYKRGSLRGSVNFGNDIGWFRLDVRYWVAENELSQYLSFEVQPTKMAMAKDLEDIHRTIDEFYPLWRFSFAQKTEQELAKSRKPHERFTLLWLAHFQRLRSDLEKGIKRICNAPHSRLLPYQRTTRAERLRGRLPPKMEERITGHLDNGETWRQYQVTGKRLSVDTPENRFIKMVLNRSSREIACFKKRAEQDALSPDRGRLSTTFFNELDDWKRPLEQLLKRPLFTEVGAFDGQTSESLVLHHRDGYAGVYRIWQELKLYLDLFGRHATISMKSVAELYEVWCLLEVRRLLLGLGFTEKANHRAILNSNGLEKNLVNGIGAAFHLERVDGIKIRLAHEPVFRRTKNPKFGSIYTWTTVQKPDIFLEATFPDKERVQWIFDAKYRIADDGKGTDFAPDDAINQMHRYRDALIHINRDNDGEQGKSRPILGAFVLYPGWFDEANSNNPYHEAIEAVGIGGFPLLPGQTNIWLRNFLEARFGDANVTYTIPEPDQYYIEESSRITQMGTYLGRYTDLTLAAPLGPMSGRDKDYLQRFQTGTAGWYHIRASATDKKSIARHVMREVRHCAVAVYHGIGKEKVITHLYEVNSVRLVKRCDMDIKQAGKIDSTNEMEYWLFELGYARPLEHPVRMSGLRTFRFQLTNAAELLIAKDWDDLPNRYKVLG